MLGKLGGSYDPLLPMTPTGSASNTIEGFTNKSILHAIPLRNTNRRISSTDAARFAGKLKGTKILVIDEVSLLALEKIFSI